MASRSKAPVVVDPSTAILGEDSLSEYALADLIAAVGNMPTTTNAEAFTASQAMGRVYSEVKSRHDQTVKAAMPVASRIVFAAFDANVFTNVKGMGVSEYAADKPLSMSAYARTIGQSHTYVARLLRLARAERAGIEEGTPAYSTIAQHGSASTFAFLDSLDEGTTLDAEAVTVADAERVGAIAAKRETSKAEATARELDQSRKAELDSLSPGAEAMAHLNSVAGLLREIDDADQRAAIAERLAEVSAEYAASVAA